MSFAPAETLIELLLAWYDTHRRELPWRALPGAAAEPYHVLLSEFMLQQTQVATVRARFAGFLARFPSLEALAAATEADVLHAWQGLGYYRRARALHACACAVVAEYGGRLPQSEPALRALPGIGPYTAAALRAIAFDAPAVPVDGNVLRVMARLHRVEAPLPGAAGRLAELASELSTTGRPGDVAQALMDLGATVCRPKNPSCLLCPWQGACRARATGVAESLPRRAAKPARPVQRGLAFLLRRPDGAILFQRRPAPGLLAGLHMLPTSPWQEGPLRIQAALDHAPVPASWRVRPGAVRHGFTHLIVELGLAEAVTHASPCGEWCPPARLGRLALPRLTTKLLQTAGIVA